MGPLRRAPQGLELRRANGGAGAGAQSEGQRLSAPRLAERRGRIPGGGGGRSDREKRTKENGPWPSREKPKDCPNKMLTREKGAALDPSLFRCLLFFASFW